MQNYNPTAEDDRTYGATQNPAGFTETFIFDKDPDRAVSVGIKLPDWYQRTHELKESNEEILDYHFFG